MPPPAGYDLWASGQFVTHLDVLIERPVGYGTVMQSYASFHGHNWIKSLRVRPSSSNQPIGSGVLTLRREIGALSLAPLMSGSIVNQDGVLYAPALDFGREIQIRTAITPSNLVATVASPAIVGATTLGIQAIPYAFGVGTEIDFAHIRVVVTEENEANDTQLIVEPLAAALAVGTMGHVSLEPATAEWEVKFRGITDDVEWPRKVGDVTIPFRDLSGQLVDSWVMDPATYGSEAGTDALEVLQSIADNHFRYGAFSLDDRTTGARLMVTSYPIDNISVWQALLNLALEWGGKTLRQVEEESGAVLAVIEPPRDKTEADYAVGPDVYLEVNALSTNRAGLRPVVRGQAIDRETGLLLTRQIPPAETMLEDPLVQKYGVVPLFFSEDVTKGIGSQEELDAMVEAIYADVSISQYPLSIETKYCPFAQVDDVVEWGANTLLFDLPLSAAVVDLEHVFDAPGKGRTLWQAAPRPRGVLADWIRRSVQIAGPASRPPVLVQSEDFTETETTGTHWLRFLERAAALVTVIEAQSKIGEAAWSGWDAPTRGPGDASVVKGGTLAAGEYEQDVGLAASRLSSTRFRYGLQSGESVTLEPRHFDRDRTPRLLDVVVSGTVVKILADAADTRSVRLKRSGGTWEYHVDGLNLTADVTQPGTNAVAGMGAADTWNLEACALADPVISTSGSTPSDCQTVQVSGGTAPAEPVWENPVLAAPATVGSSTAKLTLEADSAPGGYTARVWERHRREGEGWTDFVNVSSLLSPTISAPSTTRTEHSWTSGAPRTSSGLLYDLEMKAEILDGSSVVVETVTKLTSWYVSDIL